MPFFMTGIFGLCFPLISITTFDPCKLPSKAAPLTALPPPITKTSVSIMVGIYYFLFYLPSKWRAITIR